MDNQERDAEIVQGYLKGKKAAALARDHRLSTAQIWKILERNGAKREDVVSEAESSKVIDPDHIRLGNKLYNYRFGRLLETAIAADRMGWSAKKLRNIEQGHSVITVPDLKDMARFMETTMSDLMKGLE